MTGNDLLHTKTLLDAVDEYVSGWKGLRAELMAKGALISLRAECSILEEIALAALEVDDPPARLAHALDLLDEPHAHHTQGGFDD